MNSPNIQSGVCRLHRLLAHRVRYQLMLGFTRLKYAQSDEMWLLRKEIQRHGDMLVMGRKFEMYPEFQAYRSTVQEVLLQKGASKLQRVIDGRYGMHMAYLKWLNLTRRGSQPNSQRHSNRRTKLQAAKRIALCLKAHIRQLLDDLVEGSRVQTATSTRRTVLKRLVATLNNYEIRVAHFQCSSRPQSIGSFEFVREVARLFFCNLKHWSGQSLSTRDTYLHRKASVIVVNALQTKLAGIRLSALESIKRHAKLNTNIARQQNSRDIEHQMHIRILIRRVNLLLRQKRVSPAFRTLRQHCQQIAVRQRTLRKLLIAEGLKRLHLLQTKQSNRLSRAAWKALHQASNSPVDSHFVEVSMGGIQLIGSILAVRVRPETSLQDSTCRWLLAQKLVRLAEKREEWAFSHLQGYSSIEVEEFEQFENSVEVVQKEIQKLLLDQTEDVLQRTLA